MRMSMRALPALKIVSGLLLVGIVLFAGAGCEKSRGAEYEAPHGGLLVVLGEHRAHLEIVLDHEAGEVIVYVLGPEAETPLWINQPHLAMRIIPIKLNKEKHEELIYSVGEAMHVQLEPVPAAGEQHKGTWRFHKKRDVFEDLLKFEGIVEKIPLKKRTFKHITFYYPESMGFTPTYQVQAHPGEDEHDPRPPHGGTLVEVGDDFAYVELVLDHEQATLTAWVYGPRVEQPLVLNQPFIELEITPTKLRRDVPGDALYELHEPFMLELHPLIEAPKQETFEYAWRFGAELDALRYIEEFEGAIEAFTARGHTYNAIPFKYPHRK